MPKNRKYQDRLYMGDWNGLCQVCGMKFKASDLRRRWDGLLVCSDDYELRHPMDYFKPRLEEPGIPWTRPDITIDECWMWVDGVHISWEDGECIESE